MLFITCNVIKNFCFGIMKSYLTQYPCHMIWLWLQWWICFSFRGYVIARSYNWQDGSRQHWCHLPVIVEAATLEQCENNCVYYIVYQDNVHRRCTEEKQEIINSLSCHCVTLQAAEFNLVFLQLLRLTIGMWDFIYSVLVLLWSPQKKIGKYFNITDNY